jgi:Leucine-rich repeat (LRR) protein
MTGPVRKWFVLSLRGAMLLVLLSGLWMGWKVNRANDQRRTVAAILRARGSISYDYQFSVSKGYRRPNARPSAPAWLRKWLGDEFFQEVTSVQFINRPLTDLDLAPLARLDRLEEFHISGAPITDSGLKHLANLKELRILSLWRTPGITDAGLAYLTDLTKLQHLNLYHCEITDAGLVHLRTMEDLETLNIARTGVTGPGLSHLGRMSRLRKLFTPTNSAGLTHIGRLYALQELCAYQTRKPIPGDGLAHLANLKSLRILQLGDNLCSDAGLATLSGLSGLTQLGIGGERVTDAGMNHLAKLRGLQELTVHKSRVTGDGLALLLDLPGLTSLDLQGSTGVGDSGVEPLSRLTCLRILGLTGTTVSDDGMTVIRRALPMVRMIR